MTAAARRWGLVAAAALQIGLPKGAVTIERVCSGFLREETGFARKSPLCVVVPGLSPFDAACYGCVPGGWRARRLSAFLASCWLALCLAGEPG